MVGKKIHRFEAYLHAALGEKSNKEFQQLLRRDLRGFQKLFDDLDPKLGQTLATVIVVPSQWETERIEQIRFRVRGALELRLTQWGYQPGEVKAARPRRKDQVQASLDLRAVEAVMKLGRGALAWGPTEVAEMIGSHRSSLLRKKADGTPSCPMFQSLWDQTQEERESRRLERLQEGVE